MFETFRVIILKICTEINVKLLSIAEWGHTMVTEPMMHSWKYCIIFEVNWVSRMTSMEIMLQ